MSYVSTILDWPRRGVLDCPGASALGGPERLGDQVRGCEERTEGDARARSRDAGCRARHLGRRLGSGDPTGDSQYPVRVVGVGPVDPRHPARDSGFDSGCRDGNEAQAGQPAGPATVTLMKGELTCTARSFCS